MRLFTFMVLSGLILSSCGSDSAQQTKAAQEDAGETRFPLVAFSASPSFSDAKIDDMVFQDGKFDFAISGDSYSLGEQTSDASTKMCANSGKGQHIHLIVDKNPYSAQYVPSFDFEIPNGQHNLLAFLSRSYHESIKHPGAAVAARVTVQNNTITDSEDIVEPTLFYSRPKGTYVGKDTERIMVDFYPVAADVGGLHRIKLQVNGEVTMLDEWKPHFITGLPYGESTIGVALVYEDGSEVEGLQTAVMQKITLLKDPLPAN
ncbi:MAG: hypothetical protein KTR24_00735 [Saprospiraceae bacterium]|nr:hypothetical protein [Saprospiraceae bacterium]